ncbi:glutamate racemase [Halanaerobacter jeridensis]|uniref:Glutamate racemase n=1 Tax=Halanaerobacter jeridensis TaxID=706427 RepID=A0A938XV63_9FIRM|nr:glutamate racemase [Halanaerobacter jeridensis]MBM7556916.1 glutamate racemase [Halanaerobacter jeridensis]
MEVKNGIALFDSGVGGLTIAREMTSEFPAEDIVYFGDTAHLPYGPREQSEVRGFVFDIINYFVEGGAKIVIIACNTATAAGLEAAQEEFSIPIIGPINPGVEEALARTKNKKIGVIATTGTIGSSSYQDALRSKGENIEIFAKACPEFVPLVEAGELYSEQAKEVAEDYLTPLKEKEIDTLLLGCTHFPYLGGIIKEVMGPDVKLIYPGRGIALKARKILAQRELLKNIGTGKRKFYVSDKDKLSQRFVEIGTEFLNFSELNFAEFNLWEQLDK